MSTDMYFYMLHTGYQWPWHKYIVSLWLRLYGTFVCAGPLRKGRQFKGTIFSAVMTSQSSLPLFSILNFFQFVFGRQLTIEVTHGNDVTFSGEFKKNIFNFIQTYFKHVVWKVATWHVYLKDVHVFNRAEANFTPSICFLFKCRSLTIFLKLFSIVCLNHLCRLFSCLVHPNRYH